MTTSLSTGVSTADARDWPRQTTRWSVTRLATRKTWYSCKRLCRPIFPTGVCDYSKPGVEQQPPLGTWLDYGTD